MKMGEKQSAFLTAMKHNSDQYNKIALKGQ